MIFTKSDLLGMLEPFSVLATVFKNTDSERSFLGIFDTLGTEFDLIESDFNANTNGAIFTCKTCDICDLPLKSFFWINETKYRVSHIMKDESMQDYSKVYLKA